MQTGRTRIGKLEAALRAYREKECSYGKISDSCDVCVTADELLAPPSEVKEKI